MVSPTRGTAGPGATTLGTVIALCILAVAAIGCGVGQAEPAEVTLAELAADQERYDGDLVSTEGVVRTFDDPVHYWIEDDDVNRVELAPEEAVAPMVGEHVRVVGVYSFSHDQGRLITIEEIEPVGEAPRALP